MGNLLRVLIIEDSEDDTLLLLRELRKGGYEPLYQRVDTPDAMNDALGSDTWDIVIADYMMPRFSGMEALALMRGKGLDLPFIVLSGKIDEETAVQAMKAGAHDYILKGNLARLIPAIGRELREAEARSEHRRLERMLNHFFNLSVDIFLIEDFSGCIRHVNSAAERILGYTREEMLSRFLKEFVHPDDYNQSMEKRNKTISTNTPAVNYVNRFRCKDGTYKWLEWSAVPVVSEDLVYVVARDITERRHYQSEMARLDRLNLVAQMAAGIGHEIRNPMTAIRGFMQILMNKPGCGQYSGYFNLMIGELDRANSIITEFLDIARNKPAEMIRQHLNRIVEALLPLIEADAMNANKYVKVELAQIPDILLNQKEMRQLILNLTRNGLEATPPGGYVTIKTLTSENGVILAVEDQGAGINPEVLEKIGTPFFTTKENGTGLGLAICYSIATRHNASIHIETGAGGTTFSVLFNKP